MRATPTLADPPPVDSQQPLTLDGVVAAALERVAQVAASSLGVEAAAVALLGEDRRCFAGGDAIPGWLTRDPGALFRSGLAACVLAARGAVAIPDASAAESREMAEDAEALGIRAFIGIHLQSADGESAALFCAVDGAPRPWSVAEVNLFTAVAASALTELELQRRTVEAARIERQHRHDALHDHLTGLPNRACFLERLQHITERAKRNTESRFAVVFLDLDNFKAVNDSYGHLTGDKLLVEVALRLTCAVRGGDTLARLGGDEFALLVEDVHEATDVARVAGRLQNALSEPIALDEVEVFTSASIGIAVETGAGETPQHLLRSADLALYRAKARGRARFQLFDPVMHEEALDRLQLETDLRRALERDQLSVHYQPVVSISSGAIIAVEALLRWEHPTRRMVPPATFIPVAERTGLIMEIGRWVLTEACQQLQSWHESFAEAAPRSVWVNVSPKQFAQPDLARQLGSLLGDLEFDPRRLKLEITESLVIEDVESAIRTVTELKSLGVQVYMDDFGTGFSSLAYLDRLPIDGIKIERNFVHRIATGPRQRQLVRTIVTMIGNLGMEAIAEGVETVEQLDILREMGCGTAQGFLFSRPVDGLRLGELLHDPIMP